MQREKEGGKLSAQYKTSDTEVFLEGFKKTLCGKEMQGTTAILFCDIDGPLLDCTHRLPYLKGKEYDKFYGCTMADDTTHINNAASTIAVFAGLLAMYGAGFFRFVFNTSRPERTRSITNLVLDREFPTLTTFMNGLSWDEKDKMIMRKDQDFRPSGQVKVENVIEWLKRFKNSEWFCEENTYDLYLIDDDQAVIDAFESQFSLASLGANLDDSFPVINTIKIGDKLSNSELSRLSEGLS